MIHVKIKRQVYRNRNKKNRLCQKEIDRNKGKVEWERQIIDKKRVRQKGAHNSRCILKQKEQKLGSKTN